MQDPVTHALLQTLDPEFDGPHKAISLESLPVDLGAVGQQALHARKAGEGLADAVHSSNYPALMAFHQTLRDALFMELPRGLDLRPEQGDSVLGDLRDQDLWRVLLSAIARAGERGAPDKDSALSELLLFQALRLRLLVSAWDVGEYEALGGEEQDIDQIAWAEVVALGGDSSLIHPEVRPLEVLYASAALALVRDAVERSEALRLVTADLREELQMRANLRKSLREFRLAESVLLENALSGMLGQDRLELSELQDHHPLALGGMTRQAMDQRVSRGRRALKGPADKRPTRKRPALFDLMRNHGVEG
jgi:hypothetical protein